MEFKIGDKVRINPNSQFRLQGENSDGNFMIGEIIKHKNKIETGWWEVIWDNDSINLYRNEDLIIALDAWREKQLNKILNEC